MKIVGVGGIDSEREGASEMERAIYIERDRATLSLGVREYVAWQRELHVK